MALRTAIPLTPEWLQAFLCGVDLTDDERRYFRPEVFDTAIRSAISAAEAKFGIAISSETVVVRVDSSGSPLAYFPPIQIPLSGDSQILSVKWRLGMGDTVLNWPLQWIVVSEDGRSFQIVPNSGIQTMQNITMFSAALNAYGRDVPGIWEVTLTNGFNTEGELKDLTATATSSAGIWRPSVHVWNELTITLPAAAATARTFNVYGYRKEDGKPFDGLGRFSQEYPPETVTIPVGAISVTTETAWSQVTQVTWAGWTQTPAINVSFTGKYNDPSRINMDWALLAWIGKTASIGILNIAGDLVLGAGIASKGTSIDAISSNMQSTASATNTAYGARIVELRRELKEIESALFRKYNGLMVAAW